MKKLAILLSVVVLAAAIGLGVLVNQKNKANSDLAAANKLAADTQVKLDEAAAQLTQTGAELETAKLDLDAAMAAAEASSTELGGQIEAAKAEYETQKAELEQANAGLAADLKNANAKVLGLQVLLENANKSAEAANVKSTELLGLVDSATSESGQLSATLDQALQEKAALESEKAELEGKLAALETELKGQITALETEKAALQEQLAALEAEKAALVSEKDALTGQVAALEGEKQALADQGKAGEEGLNAQVTDLTAQVEALQQDVESAMAANDTLELEKADLEKQIMELNAASQAAQAPAVRHGLGMVTSIGSVANAAADKAGAAQVNTTVCSLTLDAEGKILSVIWDVQQSKITFDTAGVVTVPEPEKLLSKLEKGAAYGMVKASAIGKVWNEQIEAFAQYCVGKTVEEVLALETFDRGDGSHNAVPAVEELTASVTISVGDYLASLQKAADNAR